MENLSELFALGIDTLRVIFSLYELLTHITSFVMIGNQLSGTIPSEIGSMKNLEYLSLNNNTLTGTIPSEIGSMKNLTFLYLDFNDLVGSIPTEIGLMENLSELF
ncbi:hypothetical protein ACHAWT_000099, partial [Skeletonema menzelii]